MQLDAVAADVQSQAVGCGRGWLPRLLPTPSRRNPFMFVMREPAVRRVGAARHCTRDDPPLHRPSPDLVMELMGVAEQKTDAG